MYDITCAVVVYKTEEKILRRVAQSFLNNSFNTKLYIVDNSPDDRLKNIIKGQNIEYIFNKKNSGFGRAHNQIIDKVLCKSKYHLILNPDVYFKPFVLERIFKFIDNNPNIGLVMPKILFPDGSPQYLCRLLPTPFDFLLRRLKVPVVTNKNIFKYELKFADHNKIIHAPYLSGCFMFIRNEVFRKVGFFDERFFMYFEDVDLSRRIHKYYKITYYPEAVVYHEYDGGSCKNPSLTRHFIASAVKYFNKWGWFFDKERTLINTQVINQLN